MLKRLFVVLAGLGASIICVAPAHAELTRVDVTTRTDVAGSPYEKIVGTAHFSVDPKDPRNRVIADLDKAPTNSYWHLLDEVAALDASGNASAHIEASVSIAKNICLI